MMPALVLFLGHQLPLLQESNCKLKIWSRASELRKPYWWECRPTSSSAAMRPSVFVTGRFPSSSFGGKLCLSVFSSSGMVRVRLHCHPKYACHNVTRNRKSIIAGCIRLTRVPCRSLIGQVDGLMHWSCIGVYAAPHTHTLVRCSPSGVAATAGLESINGIKRPATPVSCVLVCRSDSIDVGATLDWLFGCCAARTLQDRRGNRGTCTDRTLGPGRHLTVSDMVALSRIETDETYNVAARWVDYADHTNLWVDGDPTHYHLYQ